WGLWSLYRRSPIGEAMTEALLALHADLEADLRTLFHEVTRGEPITAGSPPDTPAQHALLRHWERPDSLRRASAGGALLEAKGYGSPFSVVSGQRITRGEVVGRLGLPLDTLGYDIGLHEDVQLLLDVTVLGVASSATVGVRWRPLVVGDTTLAVEARAGGWLALQYPPARLVLAGSSFGVATVLARTPENRGMTWFARAGVTSLSVNEPVSAFPTLQQGSVVGYALAPGVEAQLTPTTALAVQLTLLAQVQAGRPLTHGIGPFLPVPQLTLGFR
ncbi:MAG: hypothetical protein KC656_31440, partial [Myxococcales bacterium]|nr:hypothetical protein [Myxococcales bacterium]